MDQKNKNTSSISSEVLSRGIEVFGEESIFMNWYHQPCAALGDKKPSECSDNEVLIIIGRIEYGVHS